MKIRLGVTAIISGALALSFLTAAPSQAAAPSRPDGKALVRVAGVDGIVKELSENRYRIVVPKGASISWLGTVGPRTRVGSFTPKALVAGWGRMGHTFKKSVTTTLTWTGGGKENVAALVRLSRPRLNGEGQLTFIVRQVLTQNQINEIPRQLAEFSINITRSGPPPQPPGPLSDRRTITPRYSWAMSFAPVAVDDTMSVQVTNVKGDPYTYDWYQGTANWYATSGSDNPCRSALTLNGNRYTATETFEGFACGNGEVQSSLYAVPLYSYVSLITDLRVYYTAQYRMAFGYRPAGEQLPFDFDQIIGMWDEYGDNLMPYVDEY